MTETVYVLNFGHSNFVLVCSLRIVDLLIRGN